MSGPGEEVGPGLWRWTAHHEEWRRQVASVAVVGDEEIVLVDPLLVGEGQWAGLDRLAGGRDAHVLITTHWHARSAAELARRRPGTRVWAHSRQRAAVARRAPVSDVYRIGEELPGGLLALIARPRSEVVLWEPRSRALIAGDALLGEGERGQGLHTCPQSWLPSSSTVAELRAALRPALDLPVKLVLPSHGSPVLRGAQPALTGALG
jgi:glyoxylase-like metal-dependent hydrolase (beta-lactamase superfamily II)